MVVGANPTINYNVFQNFYGPEKGLNLYETNNSFAISVIGMHDSMPKFDPRYVKMVAQYYAYSDE